MPSQIEFVGRKYELDLIQELSRRRQTSDAVFIYGDGGVGKTRLLHEIKRQFSTGMEQPISVTKPFDFNTPIMRSIEGIRLEIIESLGYNNFDDYLRLFRERAYVQALIAWRDLVRKNVSPQYFKNKMLTLSREFSSCFNTISSLQRIVLLFDTVDEITPDDVENLGFMRGLRNVLWLFAGKKANVLAKELAGLNLFDQVKEIELAPLGEPDSKTYLARKQRLIHITLDREWINKLILLTGGKPILLDLAVDWIARNIDVYAELPFGQSYQELSALPKAELEQRRAAFERHLVYRIAERRTLLDRLFIVLAHVYPLDTAGIAEFLHISEQEANDVMAEALTCSVIKNTTDARIQLHDKMQHMVNKYVWGEDDPAAGIDPSGKMRAHYNRKALSYFGRLANMKKRELDQALLEPELDLTPEQELDHFWQREILEGQFWRVAQKQLRFANLVGPQEGVDLFIKLFDYAESSQNVLIRKKLLEQMPPEIDTELPVAKKCEFLLRKARQWGDQRDYEEKEAILRELELVDGLSSEQEVNIYLELGNTLIRMARYISAASVLGQAVQISQRDDLTMLLVRSTNTLGWCYRLMGNLEAALDYYGKSLITASEYGDEHNQALILNNMGYIYALRRNLPAALDTCHQAVELLKHLECRGDRGCEKERRRDMGRVYGTIATILTEFGQFAESLRYRETALSFFDGKDLERLGSNYLARGITSWLAGNVPSARSDLEEARNIGLAYEQHKVLHYLAHISEEEGDYDKAARLFTQSHQKSQELPDPFYEINNLGDLAHLAVRRQEFSKWSEFENKFSAYKARWEMVRYDLPEGLLYKYLGDLALGAGQRKEALDFYRKGLPLIASHGGYGPYTLGKQMGDTAKLFQDNPHILGEIGSALWQFWLEPEQKLKRYYPQILPLLARWKRLLDEDTSNE